MIVGRIALVAVLIAAALLILSVAIPTLLEAADGAACPPAPIACPPASSYVPLTYAAPAAPGWLRAGLVAELRDRRRPR